MCSTSTERTHTDQLEIRSVERAYAQCYKSIFQTRQGLNTLHISDRINTFCTKIPVFEIFEVKLL